MAMWETANKQEHLKRLVERDSPDTRVSLPDNALPVCYQVARSQPHGGYYRYAYDESVSVPSWAPKQGHCGTRAWNCMCAANTIAWRWLIGCLKMIPFHDFQFWVRVTTIVLLFSLSAQYFYEVNFVATRGHYVEKTELGKLLSIPFEVVYGVSGGLNSALHELSNVMFGTTDEPIHRFFKSESCKRPWDSTPFGLKAVHRSVEKSLETKFMELDYANDKITKRVSELSQALIWEAVDRAKFHAQKAKMPLTVLPKVVIYNYSLTWSEDTWLAYQQQLEAQGWDFYLVGNGDVSWRGPSTKILAYQSFLELVHPEQVVLVTSSSNMLALGRPDTFMEAYMQLQAKYRNYLNGQKDKIIFAAAREEFSGPYERFRLPGQLYDRGNMAEAFQRRFPRSTSAKSVALTDEKELARVRDCSPSLVGMDCLERWGEAHAAAAAPYKSQRSKESVDLGLHHLNGAMYVGAAGRLQAMFESIQVEHGDEDDQVLLKEYWLKNSDKVVLDFEGELFAVTRSATPYLNNDGQHAFCEVDLLREGGGNATYFFTRTAPSFVFVPGDDIRCVKDLYKKWRAINFCGNQVRGTNFLGHVKDRVLVHARHYYHPKHHEFKHMHYVTMNPPPPPDRK